MAGRLLISGEGSSAVLAQAVTGGAILTLVCHVMNPEALHKGGSAMVLPAVAGFLLALIELSAEWRRPIVVCVKPARREPPRSLRSHHTTPAARSSATCSAVMPRTDERTRWVSSP